MDLTFLTQEQLWGLQYATQNHNAELPEGVEPLTVEAFTENVIRDVAENHYRNLISYKEQLALAMFRALPPEEQEALIAQFQIPDVIK
jgi:hypothetical protein